MQRTNYFWDMFKIYQRLREYKICITHTLTIRKTNAGYASHTLKRWRYVTDNKKGHERIANHTFLISGLYVLT